MPTEITQSAPEWVTLAIVVFVALNYVGRILSEASESWAKVLGPLGRRWRERGLRRQEERAAERTVRMADLDDMTRQRDALDSALGTCRSSQERQFEYIAYDAEWHRDLRLAAIEAGCQVPEHKSFLQWRGR